MMESKFMQEFFIISSIYRQMSSLLKEKLLQNNLPLSETQIMILFLMHNQNNMTSQDILRMGHFTSSNLLFNISNLSNSDYVHINYENKDYDQNLSHPMNLSKNGREILNTVDKLCMNIDIDKSGNILNLLSNYQENLENSFVKHLKK